MKRRARRTVEHDSRTRECDDFSERDDAIGYQFRVLHEFRSGFCWITA
jgi:hypothetical protein